MSQVVGHRLIEDVLKKRPDPFLLSAKRFRPGGFTGAASEIERDVDPARQIKAAIHIRVQVFFADGAIRLHRQNFTTLSIEGAAVGGAHSRAQRGAITRFVLNWETPAKRPQSRGVPSRNGIPVVGVAKDETK